MRELLATIQQPHLRALLERVLGERTPTCGSDYRLAPAAKFYHQAYRHGLLEHCLGVAQAVSAISATFPGHRPRRGGHRRAAARHRQARGLQRRGSPQSIELTDVGRLHGEIALGYYRIRREIEEIEGFPAELARAVGHIILSHHGVARARQPGGPVHPRGDARAHDRQPRRAPRQLRPAREGAGSGSVWSAFDRAIGTGAFFAARDGVEDATAPASGGVRRAKPPETPQIAAGGPLGL